MNCPYCNVPLMPKMTVCPKCKYDLTKTDGGEQHLNYIGARKQPGYLSISEMHKVEENMIVSTSPFIAGYRISKHIDVVFSEAAYYIESNRSSGTPFTSTMESSRLELYNELKQKAVLLGANAIIGMNYNVSIAADGYLVHAALYGTAVYAEKE